MKQALRVFEQETLKAGRPTIVQCVDIAGQVFEVERGVVTTLRLLDELGEDVLAPELVISEAQRATNVKADLLTFGQRVPNTVPAFDYPLEWEHWAVLPITTYEEWWNTKVKPKMRSRLRKSTREGLRVEETPFDDSFVMGMEEIFNETPVRQGRPFWHYGKDAATIKAQFSRYLERERMIGAYFEGRMIGFVMLGVFPQFAFTGQVLSSLAHREKATNNALIAKAVEVCCQLGVPNLVYAYWSEGSLSDFKRRCGFEKISVPRYFVPLNRLGAIALRTGLHKGVKHRLPTRLKESLKSLRRRWYERHAVEVAD